MKKLLMLAMALTMSLPLLFTSCSDDDDDDNGGALTQRQGLLSVGVLEFRLLWQKDTKQDVDVLYRLLC